MRCFADIHDSRSQRNMRDGGMRGWSDSQTRSDGTSTIDYRQPAACCVTKPDKRAPASWVRAAHSQQPAPLNISVRILHVDFVFLEAIGNSTADTTTAPHLQYIWRFTMLFQVCSQQSSLRRGCQVKTLARNATMKRYDMTEISCTTSQRHTPDEIHTHSIHPIPPTGPPRPSSVVP